MNPEGQLTITLERDGPGRTRAGIQSSRPLAMPRIFHGKSVDHLLATLPMLYRVCGTAQAAAAVSACEQALGIPAPDSIQQRRNQLVWLETAKEHLWRILIDWAKLTDYRPQPELIGQIGQLQPKARRILFGLQDPFRIHPEPQNSPSPRGRGVGVRAQVAENMAMQESVTNPTPSQTTQQWQTLIRDLEILLGSLLFGETPQRWLDRSEPGRFKAWLQDNPELAARTLGWVEGKGWGRLGEASCPFLEAEDPLALEPQLQGETAAGFIAAPSWNGDPRETGVLARNHAHPMVQMARENWGNGLMTRMIARLTELAQIPQRLAQLGEPSAASTPTPATGIAAAHAARGLLIHRAEIHDHKIANYTILAPTEWNFHPQGILTEALASIDANDDDELRQQAGLLIGAIDPCVGYVFEVSG
jgi:hypothetical protein